MDQQPDPPPAVATMKAKMAQSRIHTYHCLCTHLVVATTTPIASLPRRSANSLDKAHILVLPPPPSSSTDSDSEGEGGASNIEKTENSEHYALLLSTVLNKKAQIITRTDGFEKRYLQLCGRCRLPIGYQLDWGQYGEKEGRREDVVYLLPGGMTSTEEMAEGKDMASSIGFEEARIVS